MSEIKRKSYDRLSKIWQDRNGHYFAQFSVVREAADGTRNTLFVEAYIPGIKSMLKDEKISTRDRQVLALGGITLAKNAKADWNGTPTEDERFFTEILRPTGNNSPTSQLG